MLLPNELKTFEAIAHNVPNFRQWVAGELAKQHEILVQQLDEVQVRRAQGYALCLNKLLVNLDFALNPRR